MKILLVSYFFPPYNVVGAVRVGKLAKYLVQLGHDVKVLTADKQTYAASLPVEIDEDQVVRTKWLDVNKPVQMLLGGKKSVAVKGYERAGRIPRFVRKLGYYYKDIVNMPDGQIGWYPFGLSAGKKLLASWRPDFIIASASPVTSLLIARRLGKIYRAPWIADFRDLWSDNHNADIYQSSLRRFLDKKIEKRVLASAHALITVSEPLAETLRRKYPQEVCVITNGYDLDDYPQADAIMNQSRGTRLIKIVYTGIIHPVKRDPTPLFQALKRMGNDAKRIQIHFYGRSTEIVRQTAEMFGVQDCVHCHDTVSYQASLKMQVNADILLMLTYNSDAEKGVITSKFFEYLGARRPVLLIGCVDGVAGNLIRERQVGYAENDPAKIARILERYIAKVDAGDTQALSLDAIQGFSRKEQAAQLAAFLLKQA